MQDRLQRLSELMRDREPTTARKNAQLKQQIREALCVHPFDSLRWLKLEFDKRGQPINYKYPMIVPSIQFCTDCMKVVRLYEQ